jgi:iron(III) transport system permease protein
LANPLTLSAALGLIGYVLLPWFGVEYGIFERDWIDAGGLLSPEGASGLLQSVIAGRFYLLLPGAILVFLLGFARLAKPSAGQQRLALGITLAGLLVTAAPGFLARWTGLDLPALGLVREPLGYGAMVALASMFFSATTLWSKLGRGNRDAFVVGSIAFIVALIGVFVFYPLAHVLGSAFSPVAGRSGLESAWHTLTGSDLWSMSCWFGGRACGSALNSLTLGIMTATSTTILGLAFALLASRTRFPAKRLLRALAVLPVITPPFVVGLALILLFGRAGSVTQFFADITGMDAGRWFYGIWGVWLGQTLAFTPIAFLVLVGVVEGVSPSLEEAAQTLRADLGATMRSISLPLFKPGIANAFLLGFIESLADFGNPLVLGGSHGVLSTDIYFAVVGAQADAGRAGVLALVLLCMTLGAFLVQRQWLGKANYTTITGKGDSGAHAPLSRRHSFLVHAITVPWLAFTVIIYVMIFYGSVVKLWGLDHTLTLQHYVSAFGVEWTERGLWWNGRAWDSFWTTISLSAIAAPITAAVGLLTAWLLVRQNFFGKATFEFATMLSFAVPGTVVGVSYILAFNAPPVELTGTGIILVLCFVFRNMPVGVRGGVAAMKQLDPSLDEASLTLGANSFQTLRVVILPLLRPAIVAAIAYSFVRAITSVSAVIFLVTADQNMATAYIIGLVESGEYGVAIAYSSVLIVVMLVVVTGVQLLFGKRTLRRENRVGQTRGVVAPTPKQTSISEADHVPAR